MSYHLFLDDTRRPDEVNWVFMPDVHWTIVRRAADFVQTITERGIPETIAYDCDLCDEHYQAYFIHKWRFPLHYKEFKIKCGIHCVEWMIEYCRKLGKRHPHAIVHSTNKYARPHMEALIKRYNKECDEKRNTRICHP